MFGLQEAFGGLAAYREICQESPVYNESNMGTAMNQGKKHNKSQQTFGQSSFLRGKSPTKFLIETLTKKNASISTEVIAKLLGSRN